MVKVQDILNQIEEFAPLNLKMEGDPTGFQIGNRDKEVTKVMTTLDVRPEVVQEAIEKNIDLIVAHHPIMFKPAINLDISSPQNKMYFDLMKNDIAVHSIHTNIDKTVDGMNDWLSEKLQLKNIKSIEELEGLGRTGELDQAMSIEDFAEYVKTTFELSGLRFIRSEKPIDVKRIAIIGGDGGKFYPILKDLDIDTFITGDVYYHTAHDMQAINLNVVDPGHHIEAIFINEMAQKINTWAKNNSWNIDVVKSVSNTEPFNFI